MTSTIEMLIVVAVIAVVAAWCLWSGYRLGREDGEMDALDRVDAEMRKRNGGVR